MNPFRGSSSVGALARTLVGIVVGLVVVAFVRLVVASLLGRRVPAPGPAPGQADRERLVRCSVCGTAVPEGRSLRVFGTRREPEVVCGESCRVRLELERSA